MNNLTIYCLLLNFSDDVNNVHARLKTISSLSQLFLIASLEIPYIQLTNTVPTSDSLLLHDNFRPQQQMFVPVPEEIVTHWIESISKAIQSCCLWFANYILYSELSDVLNRRVLLDEILVDLVSYVFQMCYYWVSLIFSENWRQLNKENAFFLKFYFT